MRTNEDLKKEILGLLPVNLPTEHGRFMIELTAALADKGMPYPVVCLVDGENLQASFRIPDPSRPGMPMSILSIDVFDDLEDALVVAAGGGRGFARELLIGEDMEEHVKAVHDLWLKVTA